MQTLVLILQRSYDKLPDAYSNCHGTLAHHKQHQNKSPMISDLATGGLYNVFDEWLKTGHQTMPVTTSWSLQL